MPQSQEKQKMTVAQAADMFYKNVKDPSPDFNDLRKIGNELKQQGGGKIRDRDLIIHLQQQQPWFKNNVDILDLTDTPPATSAAAGAVKKQVDKVAASPQAKAFGKLAEMTKEVISSDPIVATSVAAAKNPFTPLSETFLGPGRNLEAAVRAGNKRAMDAVPAGIPRALTALPRFAQDLVARTAATVDQLQTPAGMASIVLGATPLGGFLGKAMPWLTKMASTAFAGSKAWDTAGDLAEMADKGVSAEGLANTAYDAMETGLGILGMKAGGAARKEAPSVAPPAKASATPPALPPGTDLATIPKSATAEERQLKEMPVQALRDQATDLLRKLRGVHGETSPYKTDTERIRATSTLQQRLASLNKHIVDKGGTPVNIPPPEPGGPSAGKINLQHEAAKTSTGLPAGAPPQKRLAPGQYEMPGNRGELGPGEQTQYGPKTADKPNEFNNQKAAKVARAHNVQPDDVLEMSRQSNDDLRDATNQLIHLRAQLHATGGSATYIDQLTNHINAMTDVLLERDRVSTAPPPGR